MKFKTWLPKGKSAFQVQTPEDMPKLHGLFILAGHRGAGKGVAMVSMLRAMKRAGAADRIFWLAPTCGGNKQYTQELGVQEQDCYDSPDNAAIEAVMGEVEQEAKEWEDYLEAKTVYAKLHRELRRGKGVDDIDNVLLLAAERLGLLEDDRPPKYRYNKETPAVLHAVFDDCMGTKVMSSSGSKSLLTNLCVRHRHLGPWGNGKALGLTVWIATQSWKASGSVPRAVRENCTGALIWRCPQAKMLQHMADELATGREREGSFEAAYEAATGPQHGFLYVDLTTTDPDKRYRAGWNQYLLQATLLGTHSTHGDHPGNPADVHR